VANWLNEKGVPEFAEHIKSNYLTGTAITIIIALLILLMNPGRTSESKAGMFIRRCPVCDKRVIGRGNYCSECGSKI
jgi:hypothetical protein